MAERQAQALFSEFNPATYNEWLVATKKSLRGRSIDTLVKQTYEGIDIHPLTGSADLDGMFHLDTLPGQFPYLRGTHAAGYHEHPWLIAQDLGLDDPQEYNRAVLEALASGQSAVFLGAHPQLNDRGDLETVIENIDLAQVPLLLPGGDRAIDTYRLLRATLQDETLAQLKGCVGVDPLHGLAESGSMAADVFDEMAAFVRAVDDASPQLGSIAVRSDIYHDAGAHAVQEMALALSTAVVYLREMIKRDFDVDLVAGTLHFFLCIGENFFMEVAKLRAIKLLWAQILRAFGGGESAQKIKLHLRSGRRNKTQFDAHVNMLRATTEALAAAIAGVDSLTIAPFDAPLGSSSEFSRRIARNLQLILQQELQLTRLIDPAGGAWHVEKLTAQLAQRAWLTFQQIEAGGGMIAALKSGEIQAQIEAVTQQRRRDVAQRRAVLVGSNMYPDLGESTTTGHAPRQEQDASTQAHHLTVTPLRPMRLAAPFEALRQHAENYRLQEGHLPRLFLTAFGQSSAIKRHKDFLRGIYEVGGFECIEGAGYDSIDATVQATLLSDAVAVVICAGDEGSDAMALQYIRALKAENPHLVVIAAVDSAERDSDCHTLNRALQRRLGMGV